jgi:hypothetical protein
MLILEGGGRKYVILTYNTPRSWIQNAEIDMYGARGTTSISRSHLGGIMYAYTVFKKT